MHSTLPQLREFIIRHRRLTVLTGAGLSTGSGIPDYRDHQGAWKHPAPVQYRDFVRREATRQRYWARSLAGWERFSSARPNPAHLALAAIERLGYVGQLLTQNVDRLHQQAGSRQVMDLHGRLDRVVCLDCGALTARAPLQRQLAADNPRFTRLAAATAPDGDAELAATDFTDFRVPVCSRCGGTLKPDVVFFGEALPKRRVAAALDALLASNALLVIGSSLMVYSGFRFCRVAAEHGLPIAAINLGRTRADDLLELKVSARCERLLPPLAKWLAEGQP
jgi:NAD-dependent SIR2 family protein deacetylase